MRIRDFIALVYCLALTFGAWWMLHRNDDAVIDFVTTDSLPANRWLRPGDVVLADWGNRAKAALSIGKQQESAFVGRYLRGAMPKGTALRAYSTDSVPNLPEIPGHLTLVAELKHAANMPNAESCVMLRDMPAPVRVRTVLCPGSELTDCNAIVDIPRIRLTEIAATATLAVVATVECK